MIQLSVPQNLNTMLYQITLLPGDVCYIDDKSVWALVGPLKAMSSSVYRQHKQCFVGDL